MSRSAGGDIPPACAAESGEAAAAGVVSCAAVSFRQVGRTPSAEYTLVYTQSPVNPVRAGDPEMSKT
jgi:hypothetical protein